jgi:hypothetical protein
MNPRFPGPEERGEEEEEREEEREREREERRRASSKKSRHFQESRRKGLRRAR